MDEREGDRVPLLEFRDDGQLWIKAQVHIWGSGYIDAYVAEGELDRLEKTGFAARCGR